MPSYGVQFVEGTSFRAGDASAFTGLRNQLSVKASSRAEAYVMAYRELAE